MCCENGNLENDVIVHSLCVPKYSIQFRNISVKFQFRTLRIDEYSCLIHFMISQRKVEIFRCLLKPGFRRSLKNKLTVLRMPTGSLSVQN